MKVTVFTVNDTYKLKSEEGDVLRMQPAAGWKTIRGAKAWAEKHGYEFEQEEKGANTMASKSAITNVVVETKFNTAYVYYSTGTEKMYPANKLPKTVAKWLAEHEATEEEADQEADQNDQKNDQIEPESDQNEPENAQVELVSAQTHRELPGQSRAVTVHKPTGGLALDIVGTLVTACLMITRAALIGAAYLMLGLVACCRWTGEAIEWMTPRTAALIQDARTTWTETVRPACKAAAVWMAEAVWFILI